MQILAICTRRVDAFSDAQFAALADEEAEGVRRLYAAGIVRNAWSRDDVPGACLLLETESAEAASAALGGLPFARAGMLEVQLIALRGYRGFGPQNAP